MLALHVAGVPPKTSDRFLALSETVILVSLCRVVYISLIMLFVLSIEVAGASHPQFNCISETIVLENISTKKLG